MYELDAEAEVVYKEIVEKYNDQFNLTQDHKKT